MKLKKIINSFLIIFDVIFILILLSSPLYCGEIFFWTDENGIRHYTNVEPSSSSSVQNIESYEEKYDSDSYNQFQNLNNKTNVNQTIEQNISSSSDKKNRNNNTDKDNNASGKNLPDSLKSGNNIIFRAVKIYDGDSLKVEGAGMTLMVRLVGIDAPEYGKRDKSNSNLTKQGQPFSIESRNALLRMVDEKEFYIKSYGTDSYNRLLAEVFTADGTCANLEIMKQGMAEVYRGSPPKGFNPSPYYEAEKNAKNQKIGIWSLGADYQSPKSWRKQNPSR